MPVKNAAAKRDKGSRKYFQALTKSSHIAALVSYRIFPSNMGGQKGIAYFYRYLSRLMPVTLISTKNNDEPTQFNGKFIRLLGHSKWRYINPFLIGRLKKILKENNCRVLVLEHPYYGWLGYFLKRSRGISLVVHSHNIEALRFKSTGRWWWKVLWIYERFTYHIADECFFISAEDRQYAIEHYGLAAAKSHVITYGFEMQQAPFETERSGSRKFLETTYGLSSRCKILFFNGTLDYGPNLDAVDIILQEINPRLLQATGFEYKIIICGKALPGSYHELKGYQDKHIIYAGFVTDINSYFKGSDIFINPVLGGGGIKTKLVEALGFGLAVITTASGAIGVPLSVTGEKMTITPDGDWQEFTDAIVQSRLSAPIPPEFFDHFYWGNIAAKAKAIIDKIPQL